MNRLRIHIDRIVVEDTRITTEAQVREQLTHALHSRFSGAHELPTGPAHHASIQLTHQGDWSQRVADTIHDHAMAAPVHGNIPPSRP